jgi:hypothetical protein
MTVEGRRLADRAVELLAGVEAFAERLEELSPEDRLQMAVMGGMRQANADQRWTLELAVGYALAAIALELSGPRPPR